MNVLKNHGEKIVLAVVVVVCALFAYMEWNAAEAEPKELQELESYKEKIKVAITQGKPSDKYPFGPQAAAKVGQAKEAYDANLERATKKPEADIPAYVAYPVVSRPFVDPKGRPLTDDELTHHEYAELMPLGEVKAEGDHGRVFVTFQLPRKMKYMDVVRVEVFRGMAADKIDTSQAYGTVALGPEDLPPDTAAPAKEAGKEATAAAEKPTDDSEMSTGAKRRAARAAAGETEAPTRGRTREKEPKKTEEIPAEYADVKVFSDTHVEPKKTYYYQARLIGRMGVADGKRFETKNAAGAVTRVTIIHAPKSAKTVASSKPNVVLYTTDLSGVANATPPASFQIRLAGTSGRIDPPGTAEFKRTKEYKGTFAVRVWVTEAQAWKEKTIEAAPDDPLKGTITYKAADGGDNKTVEFDSGYKLVEIKWGETVRETEVEEQEMDKDGNPIVDKKTGRPKTVKVVKKSEPIPNEVAVLDNVAEKKLEDFPKRADFVGRKSSLAYYQRIYDEQEKAAKVFKHTMEKVKERVKAADAARAAEKGATEETQPADTIKLGR